MNVSARGGIEAAVDAARNIPNVEPVANDVQNVTGSAQRGVTETRYVIRAQSIVAAIAIFAVGYFIGRIDSAATRRV